MRRSAQGCPLIVGGVDVRTGFQQNRGGSGFSGGTVERGCAPLVSRVHVLAEFQQDGDGGSDEGAVPLQLPKQRLQRGLAPVIARAQVRTGTHQSGDERRVASSPGRSVGLPAFFRGIGVGRVRQSALHGRILAPCSPR